MKTARFLPAQIWTIAQADAGNAVYIRPDGTDMVLPVYVSETDIQAILVELTHILAPRPMIHELLLSAIEAMHGRLDRVEIYGIRSGTYLCRVILVHEGKEFRLESRPSDILCLAARIDCPVHVEDGVLNLNGIPMDKVSGQSEAMTRQDLPLPVSDLLRKELQSAVDHEEFERAAVLRDQLSELGRLRNSDARDPRISE
jgi:bifunctional DNase/RNase